MPPIDPATGRRPRHSVPALAMKDFTELAAALEIRQRERAAEVARERARQREAEAERRRVQRLRDEFARAVGAVHTLPDPGRADVQRPRPAPEPLQRLRDEREALREALSDEVDIESLLLTDDGLSFRRTGIGPDVVTKLRRGHWAIQSQIDLHGLRREEAREALAGFVREAMRRGQRCVRVVHGKGHGSPGRQPVLKAKVQRWLGQCAEVIAFAQASAPQGGAGALIVLLAG
jgi:DNA-nicking Smr family endonuclease